MLKKASTSYSLAFEQVDHLQHLIACKQISNVCSLSIFSTSFTYYFPVFIHAQSDQEAALFESQASTMVTLTKGCKSVKVVRDIQEVPAGCGSAILTQTVAVHILVRVNPNSVSFNVI
jgi:hypothetical protein